MKKITALLTTMALIISSCASSGGGGGGGSAGFGGNAGTMFSEPTAFSVSEFQASSKAYAKKMVKYNGGGVDSFKKLTIPTYTLEIQKNVQAVSKNKVAALLAKADGAKSELTMNMSLPVDLHDAVLKEISQTSYNRLKGKFKSSGVEVVEWSDVKTKYPEAIEFEKEKTSMEPVVYTENMASYTAGGLGRLSRGMWQFKASSLSRDSEISIILPNFAIGYGYFGGEATSQTIKEANGMTDLQFTPQLQVYSGSGFSYQSKWDTGVVVLDKTLISNDVFVKKMSVVSDTREAAREAGEKARGAYMSLTGAKEYETRVSTRASINYELILDEAQFKKAILAELDKAENLIVERYKNEF